MQRSIRRWLASCALCCIFSCRPSAEWPPPGAPAPRSAPAGAPLGRVTCTDPTLVHAEVYPAPRSPAIRDATIRIAAGKIVAVEPGGGGAQGECVVDVSGRVVVAGFWNTHVHFTDPRLNDPAQAAALIGDMLLRYGFTSVVDTGADPRVIRELRSAIAAGRIAGPRIVAAGGGFVYEDGTPSYLPKGMLPEITTPAEADAAVAAVLAAGADGIKIFSGSFQTPSHTIHLPTDVIAAISSAAHRRGTFVVSHPTDRTGLVNAVDGGVDVLAHTAPPAGALEPELIQRMRAANVALTPTLKLWRWELERHGVPEAGIRSYLERAVQQVRDYHRAGGELLFGTDVGYMQDYDAREEIALLSEAGLDFDDLLAMLTTHPAKRFTETRGTVVAGESADLVILGGDPKVDVTALARVDATLRNGVVVFQR